MQVSEYYFEKTWICLLFWCHELFSLNSQSHNKYTVVPGAVKPYICLNLRVPCSHITIDKQWQQLSKYIFTSFPLDPVH